MHGFSWPYFCFGKKPFALEYQVNFQLKFSLFLSLLDLCWLDINANSWCSLRTKVYGFVEESFMLWQSSEQLNALNSYQNFFWKSAVSFWFYFFIYWFIWIEIELHKHMWMIGFSRKKNMVKYILKNLIILNENWFEWCNFNVSKFYFFTIFISQIFQSHDFPIFCPLIVMGSLMDFQTFFPQKPETFLTILIACQ